MEKLRSAQIPPRIISFWHDPEKMPKKLRVSLSRSHEVCSGMECLLVGDEDVRSRLRSQYGSSIERLYARLRLPAARADLARIVQLHELGGIYMDSSFAVRRSLGDLVSEETEHLFVQRDDVNRALKVPGRAALINGLIGAAKGSPLMARCVDRIINNLVDGHSNKRLVHAMGAGVLTNVVDGVKDRSRIRLIGMGELRDKFVDHLRVDGYTNDWVEQQKDGIIAESYMEKNSSTLERRWSLGSSLFHLRISRLKL